MAMGISFSYQSSLFSLALLIFIKILFSYTNKNKKLPPSPLSLPFVKKPLHHTLSRIAKRYGPATFLRFGSRPVLVVSSYSLADQCFTTHDLAFANRVCFPSAKKTSFNYSGIGTSNYGPHWRNVRRIAAVELLSPQRLVASSDVRSAEVVDMARRQFNSWKEGSKLNNGYREVKLKTYIFEVSLNLMMTTIAGKRFYWDNIDDVEIVKKFRETIEMNLSFFFYLKGVMKKKKELAKRNDEMTEYLIDEHRKNWNEMKEKKTMIAYLLELKKKDPEGHKDQIIKAICLFVVSRNRYFSKHRRMDYVPPTKQSRNSKESNHRNQQYVGTDQLIQEFDMIFIH